MTISKKVLASMIEHTLLGDSIDEKRLCAHIEEALNLQVYGICVPLAWLSFAKKQLLSTNLKVITVVDFPLGQKSGQEKALEARLAHSLGADEIDMVLDYQALINKNYNKALDDLLCVVQEITPLSLKVIIETSALTCEQIAIASALVALSQAQFIKTSTGFHKAGAQVADIMLMRKLLPSRVHIKASGAIKSFGQACALIEAGATRIGASQSRQILENTGEKFDASY
jgi:deoxyribose-phosphate aldolase